MAELFGAPVSRQCRVALPAGRYRITVTPHDESAVYRGTLRVDAVITGDLYRFPAEEPRSHSALRCVDVTRPPHATAEPCRLVLTFDEHVTAKGFLATLGTRTLALVLSPLAGGRASFHGVLEAGGVARGDVVVEWASTLSPEPPEPAERAAVAVRRTPVTVSA